MRKDILDFLFFSKDIYDICKPLFDTTKIKFFDYECFYDSGELLILSSSNSATLYQSYFDQKLYAKKIELDRIVALKLQAAILSEFMPLPSGVSEICPMKYKQNIIIAKDHHIYHRLCLYKRENDCTKIAAFGVIEKDMLAFEFFLNFLESLKKFICYFEKIAYPIILQCIKENRVTLLDYFSVEKEESCLSKTDNHCSDLYLQNSGLIFKTLTPREIKCLSKFLTGYSAKEIGDELMISHRTVEAHIHHAKQKIGPASKQKLRHLLWEYQDDIFLNFL